MSEIVDRDPSPAVTDREPSARPSPLLPDVATGVVRSSGGTRMVPFPLAADPSERKPLRVVHVSGTESVRELCPYLMAADGTHRSSVPAREHRCAALAPAPPIASEKQRRLCLTAAHRECATFGAAVAGRTLVAGDGSTGDQSLRRPYARTTPILLERPRIAIPSLAGSRSGTQLLLGGLIAIVLAAVLIGRAPAPTGLVADASATARVGRVLPTAVLPSRAPARTLVPSGSQPADPAPVQATGGPAASGPIRTYKVRGGDTLSAIAARFGTTTKELRKLNPIKDPSRIRIGTVLTLP